MVKKVLFVLTSQKSIPADGSPTGWYLVRLCLPFSVHVFSFLLYYPPVLPPTITNAAAPPCPLRTQQPEFAHPYAVIEKKAEVVVASPRGGEAPLDPGSVGPFASDPVCATFLQHERPPWKNTVKLAEIRAVEAGFDALFFVGGHGRELFPFIAVFILFTHSNPRLPPPFISCFLFPLCKKSNIINHN